MSKINQKTVGSDIYTVLGQARMNDADRQAAISALGHAEAIVDAMFWVKNRVAALGNYLLKPSLKH